MDVVMKFSEGKEFLQETKCMPDLEESMLEMIHHIIKSGELERFWSGIEKANRMKLREAKRDIHDRQVQMYGSEASQSNLFTESEDEVDDYYDEEDEEENSNIRPY